MARLPNLNGLKFFEATARPLSVGKAAAELNVTLRSGRLTVHQCQPDQPLRVLFEQQIEVLESAVGRHR